MWRDFIREFSLHQPHHPALLDRSTGRTLSYAQLETEIRRWAGWLHAQGVEQGDRLALLAPNRLEHLTLFFACAKLGAMFVPLNHRLAAEERNDLLRRVEPRLLLGVGTPPPDVSLPWQGLDSLDPPPESPFPSREIDDDQPLLMLFTSGSTGRPKGVMLHAAMLMANMAGTVGADVLRPGDVSIVNTPFFHTGGYNVFCLPLLSIGGTLILHERFDPGLVLREIREGGVTVFWAVPTMFQAMQDHADFAATDFSSIRFFLSGGAPLSPALIQAYHRRGAPFKQGFGLTEVGPNCFLLETGEAFRRPTSIGKPMAHSRVRVVDEDGQDVGPDRVGEMLIGGPHLCQGYWRDPELFAAALREGLFATGDLVKVDREGYFYVVGRKKEMFISGGENVYPGEVEKPLMEHPRIAQAVVVGIPHPLWGEVGLAFYVGDGDLSLAEVREFLNPRLARYKHPFELQRLESMPLLANGKIDRPALKALGLRRAGNDVRAATG
ncbi:MAG: AMP-binding protein [Magnetococcales bacterium]|nr:AMP-binding protein [Magnetococcales bacterium]